MNRQKQIFLLTLSPLILSFFACAVQKEVKAPYKQAPLFELEDETGTIRRLSDMRGKKLALYFYPADNTPNCTIQACSIRDGFKALEEADITVWGVSYDSPKSHLAFKRKYNLPFTLLSDKKKKVAKKYGVKRWLLPWPVRKTFLINEEGEIIHTLKNINVADHDDQIIEAFKAAEKRKTQE